MLQAALLFFVMMLADTVFGFTGIAAAAAEIAAMLFYIFGFLLVLSLIAALRIELKNLTIKPGQ